ncbi:MAG TPA: substrate-binding domain-containing protein [Gaiellaceae bacterium]|nr:substrate-binding domain-containing protein [Gaiellaceae bacterium]
MNSVSDRAPSPRTRRRWLLALLAALALVLAVVAAGCGGDDDDDEGAGTGTEEAAATGGEAAEGSIWVLLPDSASSDRWETDDRRYFEEAFDEAGVEYNIVNAEGDANTQLQQAEQAINAGAKVILLVNLSSESGATIIDQAREADVKVVDYDRLTAAGGGADVYVSFDNVKVGQTMADTVGPVIDELDVETPKVVMMNGGPTDNNSKLFKEGYNETGDYAVSKKAEAGEWEVVADQDVPDWDNQQALTLFEQILVANDNDVDAVFAANDGIAGSVISALQSANVGPIPVSGQDATAPGIQNILAGRQTMTVYKPIKAEAEAGAEAALALLNGEDVEAIEGDWEVLSINNGEADLPYIALTPIAVTKDNIADTVIADGFRTWDEICTGEFEQFCPEDRE